MNSSRDKSEGTYRSGEGGGGPAMWPRIRVTTGRERERDARIKNGMKEKIEKLKAVEYVVRSFCDVPSQLTHHTDKLLGAFRFLR